MKAITYKALQQYRNGAKKNKNLDSGILRVKLNCLINASEHVSTTVGGTIYQFGNCKIKVDTNNLIVEISWIDDHIEPDTSEAVKLLGFYKHNGMNRAGTRYIKEDNQSDCNVSNKL